MNILVTGSSGHVGSAVAARLSAQARVIGLDLRPGPHTTRRFSATLPTSSLSESLIRGTAAVVHTAALHVPDLGRAG